jgi:hypothetical protein
MERPPLTRAVPEVLKAGQEPMNNLIDTVSKLAQAASKMPYYKFNNMWSRQMQGAVRSATTQIFIQDANVVTV